MINKKKFLSFSSKLAEAYPIGRVKYAPGTLASLVAMIFGYYVLILLNIKFFLLFVFFFIVLSYFLCEAHIRVYNKKDPKEIVIDEFGGQFIVLFATIDSENEIYTYMSLLIPISDL